MTSLWLMVCVAAMDVDKAANANRIVRSDREPNEPPTDPAEAAPANWGLLYSSSASKVLGRGGFGVARLVHLDGDTCTGENVVAKSVEITSIGTALVMNELAIMSEVDHPNLMGLFDYTPKTEEDILDAKMVTIMMPPAYGGEMHDRYVTNMTAAEAPTGVSSDLTTALPSVLANVVNYIAGEGKEAYGPRDKYAAKLLCDTASGLAHFHKLGYMHRDLKPENIWASHEECLGNEECRFIIGDFGLSVKVADEAFPGSGTALWMPPEVGGVLRQFLDAELLKCLNSCTGIFGWKALTYKSSDTVNSCADECKATYEPAPKSGWSQKGDVFSLGQALYYTLTSAQYSDGSHGQLYGIPAGMMRLGEAIQGLANLGPKREEETQSEFEARKALPLKMNFAKAFGGVVGGKLAGSKVQVDHRIAGLPKPFVKVLTSMLSFDADERPTAAEARDVACALADLPERPAPAAPACVAACRALECGPTEQCRPSTDTCEKPVESMER